MTALATLPVTICYGCKSDVDWSVMGSLGQLLNGKWVVACIACHPDPVDPYLHVKTHSRLDFQKLLLSRTFLPAPTYGGWL